MFTWTCLLIGCRGSQCYVMSMTFCVFPGLRWESNLINMININPVEKVFQLISGNLFFSDHWYQRRQFYDIDTWLLPSTEPTVPNSADKKASKCFGWRWSLFSNVIKKDQLQVLSASGQHCYRQCHWSKICFRLFI